MNRAGFFLLFSVSLPALAQNAREAEWRKLFLPFLEAQKAVTSVDPEAGQYVAALGMRLAYATPEPAANHYRFLLYDDRVGLEAPGFGILTQTRQVHALPGGIVVVPLNLFAASADEAEFASAMARAVAHVALNHFTQMTFRTGTFPKTLIFTRSLEREADYAAIAVLARAGLNPEALTRHVRNTRASFDTSEPRVRAVEEAVSKAPPRAYCQNESLQFKALKERLGTIRATV